MGVYASYDDIIHGTPAWELAEHCTACRNTGWVAYPVNVGVDENEYDECPHGCTPLDDNDRLDSYVREGTAEKLDPWAIEAWDASRRKTDAGDPFFILANHRGQLNIHEGGQDLTPGFGRIGRLAPSGQITTDETATGWLDQEEFMLATVPPYTVGTPVKLNHFWMTVRYEYLGASVDITFGEDEAAKFRFSYEYETGFSTHEMLR